MQPQITAFLDTNVLLHYLPIDHIQWSKELGSENVEIRLANTVIAELNKHKEHHSVEHMRERARKTLSKIYEVVISSSGHLVEGVTLRCEMDGSPLDMHRLSLDPASQDDQILAAVLRYQSENKSSSVVLVTGDFGFALRALGHGVQTKQLPEKLRIPARADPKQLKIRELESKLKEVQRPLPKLGVAFSDGSDRFSLVLEPEILVSPEAAQRYVASQIEPQLPARNPYVLPSRDEPVTGQEEMPALVASLLQIATQFGQTMAVKYDISVRGFLEAYTRYVSDSWKYENRKRLRHEIPLVLSNSGGAPAEEINLFLRLPCFINVYPAGDVPAPPVPPAWPGQKPSGAPAEAGPAGLQQSRMVRYVGVHQVGDQWEVQYHLPRLNHHLSERVRGLFIEYQAHHFARPFRLEYRIAAVNTPDVWSGTMHINVTNPSG